MLKMSIPKSSRKQVDSVEEGIFDEDDDEVSLGRLFAGCIAYLDNSHDEENGHTSSDSDSGYVRLDYI
jgi:hypothetical protein